MPFAHQEQIAPHRFPRARQRRSCRRSTLWRAWLTTVADETEQRVEIRALATEHGLDLAASCTRAGHGLGRDADDRRRSALHDRRTYDDARRTRAAFAEGGFSGDCRTASKGSPPRSASVRRPSHFPTAIRRPPGPREAELAKQAGLVASFTTQPGYVPGSASRHGLPRVSINGLFQDVRFLEVLLTPGLWKLRDRIRKRR